MMNEANACEQSLSRGDKKYEEESSIVRISRNEILNSYSILTDSRPLVRYILRRCYHSVHKCLPISKVWLNLIVGTFSSNFARLVFVLRDAIGKPRQSTANLKIH